MLRNPTPSMFAAHVRKIGTPVRTGNLIAAVLLAICVGPGSALAQSSGRPTTPPAPDQGSSTGSNPGVGLGPQVGPEKRFPTISASPDEISKTFRPASISGPHKVQVVVMLSADSVATSRAKMGGIKTSATHNDAIRQQALAQQTALMPLLAVQGAKVLAQFQHALNGIKVEVDSSKIATLRSLPGVVNVLPVGTYDRDNAVSVPFIGAPLVWQGIPGFRGEGIKIAVIDTGIDYTHANFGGPGTVAAFNAAAATSTAPANPALFGPGAPKVKGGTDLVGDDYWPNQTVNGAPNPNYQPIPHPDPNPLDCAFALGGGHGSHTAGTAAGFGVLNNATYTGAYNSAAYSQHFQIGPGVAPKADIYSFRVFGCNGSTEVVTDAIDLAVAANVDIISMSLGSNWGDKNSSDAVASQNAALAGITVVAASGNAGPAPYITSSPAASAFAITAAAMDGTAGFPGTNIALNTGSTVLAINANNAPLPGGVIPIVVLHNPDGSVSLGCNEAEYPNALVGGKIVVTLRGICARVDRATFGQRHGAAAVVMINTDSGFPPFENTIPDVTIPFLGVPSTNGPAVAAAASATLSSAGLIPNPTFEQVASFSSSGPRYGDSLFKPSVAAPGVSVFSTMAGTGTGGVAESGTSMSTPHIAGVAALVRQAHTGWSELAQRAAVTQTADPFQMIGFSPRLDGTGVVQPLPATKTQAVVLGTADAPDPLSFGFVEMTTTNFSALRNIDIRNNGATPITFNVKVTPTGSVPHTIAPFGPTISVPAASDATLTFKMSVPAATAGLTHPAGTTSAYHDVAGIVTLTPADATQNGGAKLNIPYYLVPRARSLISVSHNVPTLTSPSSTLTVTNGPSQVAGTADFYAWGLTSPPQGLPFADTRAVGVQSIPISATDTFLVFAINTYQRFSTASPHEWDILIDTTGDGNPDYVLIGFDVSGFVSTQPAGRFAAGLLKLSTGAFTVVRFADAPTDSTTLLLSVKASEMGLSSANPRFSYQVNAFNGQTGDGEAVGGTAKFNAFTPAISTGMFVTVPPSQSAGVPVTINAAEWAITPALGVMAVSMDNLNGTTQADLIPVAPPR